MSQVVERIEPGVASGVNVEEAIESFGRALEAENLSARTIQSYMESATQFAGFLADKGMPEDVGVISREHVESFITDLLRRYRPATAGNRYRGLQVLFKWLVEEAEIKQSPMARMKPPKVPEDAVPVLTDEELARLLKTCEKDRSFEGRRDHALLRVFIDTGARRAEVAAMRVTDEELDLKMKRMHIVGKGRRPRALALNARTVKALDRYLRGRNRHRDSVSPWLWLSRKGRMTDSGIAQMIRRRGKDAGLDKLHPHQFRHTFAHRQLSKGMQETDLMSLTGWTSREMVRRYARSTSAERAHEAYQRIAAEDEL